MASTTAREVALEVVSTVRKGKRVNVSAIARKHGYSVSSIRAAKVQKTATYKAIVAPIVSSMERVRANAIKALESKDLSLERAIELASISKLLTHDIQLLSGKATSSTEHTEDRRILLGIVDSLRLGNGSTEPQ